MTQPEFTFQSEDKILLAFKKFHTENPHVLPELVSMAKTLMSRGHKRYGIAGLFEVLRYRHSISTSGDTFKLNNNFRAIYSRVIMEKNPELDGFFETRERKD